MPAACSFVQQTAQKPVIFILVRYIKKKSWNHQGLPELLLTLLLLMSCFLILFLTLKKKYSIAATLVDFLWFVRNHFNKSRQLRSTDPFKQGIQVPMAHDDSSAEEQSEWLCVTNGGENCTLTLGLAPRKNQSQTKHRLCFVPIVGTARGQSLCSVNHLVFKSFHFHS